MPNENRVVFPKSYKCSGSVQPPEFSGQFYELEYYASRSSSENDNSDLIESLSVDPNAKTANLSSSSL